MISKPTPSKVTIVFRLATSLWRHRSHVTGFFDLKVVKVNISETVHCRTIISKLTKTKVFRVVASLWHLCSHFAGFLGLEDIKANISKTDDHCSVIAFTGFPRCFLHLCIIIILTSAPTFKCMCMRTLSSFHHAFCKSAWIFFLVS